MRKENNNREVETIQDQNYSELDEDISIMITTDVEDACFNVRL